jgi:hypothetical protein
MMWMKRMTLMKQEKKVSQKSVSKSRIGSGLQTIQSCRPNLKWSAIDALMCPIVAGVEIV